MLAVCTAAPSSSSSSSASRSSSSLFVGDFLGERPLRARSDRPGRRRLRRRASRRARSCRRARGSRRSWSGRRRSPGSCASGRLRCAWRSRSRLRASAARPSPSRACTCAPGRWCGRTRNRRWTAPLRLPRPRLRRDDGGVASDISSVSASGASSYTWMPMSLIMLMMFSICSASSMSSGRWSLISA